MVSANQRFRLSTEVAVAGILQRTGTVTIVAPSLVVAIAAAFLVVVVAVVIAAAVTAEWRCN